MEWREKRTAAQREKKNPNNRNESLLSLCLYLSVFFSLSQDPPSHVYPLGYGKKCALCPPIC